MGGGPEYGVGYGPGAGMGRGMGPMGYGRGIGPQGYGNASAMAYARLAFLKSELKITSGQETAWQAFVAKAKQQAEGVQAAITKMRDTQTSVPDRLAQRTEFMKQRLAGMETMTAAVKDLYAALTPEQKAVADQRFAGGRGYGPEFRGGPGGRFR